jgi:hypothetical protein
MIPPLPLECDSPHDWKRQPLKAATVHSAGTGSIFRVIVAIASAPLGVMTAKTGKLCRSRFLGL